jgi:hypothetical protein
MEKIFRQKCFISFGHLWDDNCSYCMPPVSFTPVANLPPVSISTTQGKLVEKFAAGVVDFGGAP